MSNWIRQQNKPAKTETFIRNDYNEDVLHVVKSLHDGFYWAIREDPFHNAERAELLPRDVLETKYDIKITLDTI